MEERDEERCRQKLINFGHSQWGFNHWSWTVTKQDLDFVDFSNGKYTAGVVGFVSVVVKSLDIQRENIGYATCTASAKGSAIHGARKIAVTNALRETLLSFGGTVTTDLQELLDPLKQQNHVETENNQNIPNKIESIKEVANIKSLKKEYPENGISCKNVASNIINASNPVNLNSGNPSSSNINSNTPIVPVARAHTAPIKNVPPPLPMAKALPIPANMPVRPPIPRPQPPRNPNEAPPPDSSVANDEEARAERKRRQKQAQEEFRLKQLGKKSPGLDAQRDVSNSFDCLLMDIPTQDIMIEQSGADDGAGSVVPIGAKRKSPDTRDGKRRSVMNRLDIVTD